MFKETVTVSQPIPPPLDLQRRGANEGADLLNNLETNVEYFNTYGSPTLDNPYWVLWGPNKNTWVSTSGLGGRQRLSSYPSDVAVPKTFVPGLSQADRDSPENLSYYHKRNFTLFLSYPRDGQQPDAQWPNQDFKDGTFTGKGKPPPVTTTVESSTWVICAVNTMGEQRYRFGSRANALCTDAQTTMPVWNGLLHVVKFYQYVSSLLSLSRWSLDERLSKSTGVRSALADLPDPRKETIFRLGTWVENHTIVGDTLLVHCCRFTDG